MASAAEQLAANISWQSFAKAGDLKKRLWFTLGALIVYRIGTYIPVPGIDPVALAQIFEENSRGILPMIDTLAGGALGRMSLFALTIMPYISASIIMQLAGAMSQKLAELKKEGEAGRKKINQYTRYLTVLLAVVQSYGVSVGLEGFQAGADSVVLNPGMFFRIATVITLTGGTVFLMWLGEQITARGVGNGISLIIFAGIVAGLPGALVSTLELGVNRELSIPMILGLFVLIVAVVLFVVFMERAFRKVMVQYPKRQVGNKQTGGESQHIPLKLNTSGVIPAIFASSLLLLPATITGFGNAAQSDFLITVSNLLGRGQPLFLLFFVAFIMFFAFFYTAIVFNPEETAENLKKQGGFIPGVRPGKATESYFDYVLTRITLVGAAYLAVVCALPEVLISRTSIPFYFGGTSLLIVVAVTLDTVAQVHSHMVAHQYEGLIKKSQLMRGGDGTKRKRRKR